MSKGFFNKFLNLFLGKKDSKSVETLVPVAPFRMPDYFTESFISHVMERSVGGGFSNNGVYSYPAIFKDNIGSSTDSFMFFSKKLKNDEWEKISVKCIYITTSENSFYIFSLNDFIEYKVFVVNNAKLDFTIYNNNRVTECFYVAKKNKWNSDLTNMCFTCVGNVKLDTNFNYIYEYFLFLIWDHYVSTFDEAEEIDELDDELDSFVNDEIDNDDNEIDDTDERTNKIASLNEKLNEDDEESSDSFHGIKETSEMFKRTSFADDETFEHKSSNSSNKQDENDLYEPSPSLTKSSYNNESQSTSNDNYDTSKNSSNFDSSSSSNSSYDSPSTFD